MTKADIAAIDKLKAWTKGHLRARAWILSKSGVGVEGPYRVALWRRDARMIDGEGYTIATATRRALKEWAKGEAK